MMTVYVVVIEADGKRDAWRVHATREGALRTVEKSARVLALYPMLGGAQFYIEERILDD